MPIISPPTPPELRKLSKPATTLNYSPVVVGSVLRNTRNGGRLYLVTARSGTRATLTTLGMHKAGVLTLAPRPRTMHGTIIDNTVQMEQGSQIYIHVDVHYAPEE
jgi:uncharacterized RmlC-like cupin family protein